MNRLRLYTVAFAGSEEDLALRKGRLQQGRQGGAGDLEWEDGLFVLLHSALVPSEPSDQGPRSVVLLERGTKVELLGQPERPFCISLTIPGRDVIYLAASSAEERDGWHQAISDAVSRADHALHGSVSVKGEEGRWTDGYCRLLRDGSLACYILDGPSAGRAMASSAHMVIESEQAALSFHVVSTAEEASDSFTFKVSCTTPQPSERIIREK